MTTPQLLAKSLGKPCPVGPHFCFFCAAPCAEDFPRDNYLSDSFTSWSLVRRPDSQFLCGGCVIATNTDSQAEQPRLFSWIISGAGVHRFSKGQIPAIRAACLAPPEPPYALVVATSGQKHLLYLAPVNYSREVVTAQVEIDRVTYRPAELAARLDLCQRIAAACGKPSLGDAPTAGLAARLAQYYQNVDPLLVWFDKWQEPLSRLAGFLCPKMEDCQHEHPSTAPVVAAPAPHLRRQPVAAEARGADGPGLFG